MKPTAKQVAALARRDPRLRALVRDLPVFPGFPLQQSTPWSSLARAIVFQQLHVNAARTIHARVCALGGGDAFPPPADLATYSEESLRACGLSRGKTKALRDLAARSLDGRLPIARLPRLADERVIELVSEVHGLGRWSGQMYLLFQLGRLDVLPSGDLGVREGVRILDDLEERPSPAEVDERGRCWRPLASVASWYLWRLVEATRERAKADAAGTREATVGSAGRARKPARS